MGCCDINDVFLQLMTNPTYKSKESTDAGILYGFLNYLSFEPEPSRVIVRGAPAK